MTEARMDTMTEAIARHLVAMGYGYDDDIVVEDLAEAARLAGFEWDANDDEAMRVLDDDALAVREGRVE